MAGNGNIRGNGGGASISTAAFAAGSTETRFFQTHRTRRRWGVCWGRLSCFGSQKRTKRIVPSSRTSDGNSSTSRVYGSQTVGVQNQTTLTPSLLAPPSSPASFTNSALASTVQSPNCFLSLSANSPGGPSSTMYATGPYAHETQLVSPPVFSTFTTEPSTAPLTPPPELAHLTTPSSPDVPYAQYLSSSFGPKNGSEHGLPFVSTGYSSPNDLRLTYPLYPESPSSSLISPMSLTPRTGMSSPYAEQEIPSHWDAVASANKSPYSRGRSWNLFGVQSSTSRDFMHSPDASFYPASSAQFYLDQAQQSYASYPSIGRPSVSKEGNRHNKTCKQDVEEIEAYRASFGFSADEIITARNYVEIPDASDLSFSLPACSNMESCCEHRISKEQEVDRSKTTSRWADLEMPFLSRDPSSSNSNQSLTDEILLRKMRDVRVSRSFRSGTSNSDAEVDYRRSRSSRHASIQF